MHSTSCRCGWWLFSTDIAQTCGIYFGVHMGFWTAGQRVDPTRLTPFVWKLMTANGYQELPLNYTNWRRGEPSNSGGSDTNVKEACLHVWPIHQYKWNDAACKSAHCYVCTTMAHNK